MQRLVYAPKAQAFVKTDSGIVDISDFIVSGTVTRQVNAVSTAEITIQNPDKRFTQPGNPTFRPMDLITIYLSRFRKFPVQVFTGYLDTSPYLQLHPGTCSLKASCTLKRLQYTYWDPGIQFTQEFLMKYDWYANPSTGTITKPPPSKNDLNQDEDGKKIPKISDGSLGNLIFLLLSEAGNWNKGSIFVEDMPKDLGKTINDIYLGLRQDDKKLEKEVQDFLVDMIGPYGGVGGPAVPDDGSSPSSGEEVTPEQVGTEMLRAGFPRSPQVIASGIQTMEGESGFGTAAGWDTEHDSGVLGYWQIQLSSHPDVSAACAMNLACSTKAALGIWKAAGNCFACLAGPNPWQGGTDNGTKYLALATKLCGH